ncbi:MAG: DUF4147 domain-containing protein [Gammaproteobacteria bacterium]
MHAPQSELLIRWFRAGLAAASPATCLPPFLPSSPPRGRTVVLGAGKAAAAMAATLATCHLERDLGSLGGAVVTRYGHGLLPGERTSGIEVLEAGHPVPDAAGVAAGTRILALARQCKPEDRCIVLLSGGASSLLVQPVPGVTLADKQGLTRLLLASGAEIGEVNSVRRKLSAIKGGGLARELRAQDLLLLAISDVPGDVVADIGSGPLSPDPTSRAEARAILARYRIAPPPGVARALEEPNGPVCAAEAGTVLALARVRGQIVASSSTAVEAVARAAETAGWPAHILPEATGPAREAALTHAAAVRQFRARGERAALISGGETTVNVTHPDGRGGRNSEYLLSLALELGDTAGIYALAADTDGLDGTGDNAGVLLTPDTLRRASAAGQDAATQLATQRSYDFFAALGDLLFTGPTRTNVNDLRIALVE